LLALVDPCAADLPTWSARTSAQPGLSVLLGRCSSPVSLPSFLQDASLLQLFSVNQYVGSTGGNCFLENDFSFCQVSMQMSWWACQRMSLAQLTRGQSVSLAFLQPLRLRPRAIATPMRDARVTSADSALFRLCRMVAFCQRSVFALLFLLCIACLVQVALEMPSGTPLAVLWSGRCVGARQSCTHPVQRQNVSRLLHRRSLQHLAGSAAYPMVFPPGTRRRFSQRSLPAPDLFGRQKSGRTVENRVGILCMIEGSPDLVCEFGLASITGGLCAHKRACSYRDE
jgi:hypothetical protein